MTNNRDIAKIEEKILPLQESANQQIILETRRNFLREYAELINKLIAKVYPIQLNEPPRKNFGQYSNDISNILSKRSNLSLKDQIEKLENGLLTFKSNFEPNPTISTQPEFHALTIALLKKPAVNAGISLELSGICAKLLNKAPGPFVELDEEGLNFHCNNETDAETLLNLLTSCGIQTILREKFINEKLLNNLGNDTAKKYKNSKFTVIVSHADVRNLLLLFQYPYNTIDQTIKNFYEGNRSKNKAIYGREIKLEYENSLVNAVRNQKISSSVDDAQASLNTHLIELNKENNLLSIELDITPSPQKDNSPHEYIILFDDSGSMRENDKYLTANFALKKFILDLAANDPNALITIIPFNQIARFKKYKASDLKTYLDNNPNELLVNLTRGDTPLYACYAAAALYLREMGELIISSKKLHNTTLFCLTDGQAAPSGTSGVNAAYTLMKESLPFNLLDLNPISALYAVANDKFSYSHISFGTKHFPGELPCIVTLGIGSDADKEFIQAFSKEGDGLFYFMSDNKTKMDEELEQVFQQLKELRNGVVKALTISVSYIDPNTRKEITTILSEKNLFINHKRRITLPIPVNAQNIQVNVISQSGKKIAATESPTFTHDTKALSLYVAQAFIDISQTYHDELKAVQNGAAEDLQLNDDVIVYIRNEERGDTYQTVKDKYGNKLIYIEYHKLPNTGRASSFPFTLTLPPSASSRGDSIIIKDLTHIGTDLSHIIAKENQSYILKSLKVTQSDLTKSNLSTKVNDSTKAREALEIKVKNELKELLLICDEINDPSTKAKIELFYNQINQQYYTKKHTTSHLMNNIRDNMAQLTQFRFIQPLDRNQTSSSTNNNIHEIFSFFDDINNLKSEKAITIAEMKQRDTHDATPLIHAIFQLGKGSYTTKESKEVLINYIITKILPSTTADDILAHDKTGNTALHRGIWKDYRLAEAILLRAKELKVLNILKTIKNSTSQGVTIGETFLDNLNKNCNANKLTEEQKQQLRILSNDTAESEEIFNAIDHENIDLISNLISEKPNLLNMHSNSHHRTPLFALLYHIHHMKTDKILAQHKQIALKKLFCNLISTYSNIIFTERSDGGNTILHYSLFYEDLLELTPTIITSLQAHSKNNIDIIKEALAARNDRGETSYLCWALGYNSCSDSYQEYIKIFDEISPYLSQQQLAEVGHYLKIKEKYLQGCNVWNWLMMAPISQIRKAIFDTEVLKKAISNQQTNQDQYKSSLDLLSHLTDILKQCLISNNHKDLTMSITEVFNLAKNIDITIFNSEIRNILWASYHMLSQVKMFADESLFLGSEIKQCQNLIAQTTIPHNEITAICFPSKQSNNLHLMESFVKLKTEFLSSIKKIQHQFEKKQEIESNLNKQIYNDIAILIIDLDKSIIDRNIIVELKDLMYQSPFSPNSPSIFKLIDTLPQDLQKKYRDQFSNYFDLTISYQNNNKHCDELRDYLDFLGKHPSLFISDVSKATQPELDGSITFMKDFEQNLQQINSYKHDQQFWFSIGNSMETAKKAFETTLNTQKMINSNSGVRVSEDGMFRVPSPQLPPLLTDEERNRRRVRRTPAVHNPQPPKQPYQQSPSYKK